MEGDAWIGTNALESIPCPIIGVIRGDFPRRQTIIIDHHKSEVTVEEIHIVTVILADAKVRVAILCVLGRRGGSIGGPVEIPCGGGPVFYKGDLIPTRTRNGQGRGRSIESISIIIVPKGVHAEYKLRIRTGRRTIQLDDASARRGGIEIINRRPIATVHSCYGRTIEIGG